MAATSLFGISKEKAMVEVTIDSIRVSLVSPQRLVILKDLDQDRFLPIWIGPFEAEAITIKLQDVDVKRPLTHDLLNHLIKQLGGAISHVFVNELRNDTYYARIVLNVNGKELEIDSRPSDAMALAVRASVPIFVAEEVMNQASIRPEEDQSLEEGEDLSAFRDFVNTLDLDDLDTEEEE
jgi:bifunctional DNase/RNase